MTDFYRDRVRHGGIFSDKFVDFWQNNQVFPNQYGNPEKKGRRWGPGKFGPPLGPECQEGTLSHEERTALRRDQVIDNAANPYLDSEYHSSRVYNLGDIEVPILSVANLGGILLHLRGNVVGYLEAGTRNKWLWFISGRHDLPFYLPHFVKLQKSFLDAWLKDEDDAGWKLGPNAKVPAVNLLVRKGNPGFNSNEAEATFAFRQENEWPLARTQYEAFYLQPDLTMATSPASESKTFDLHALGKSDPFNFVVKFDKETEIAGHPTADLFFSAPKRDDGSAPRDIDVFVTLRHLDKDGKEIYYTGTAGDPVPLCKGEFAEFAEETYALIVGQAGSALRSAPSTTNHLFTTTGCLAANTSRLRLPMSSRIKYTSSWLRFGRRLASSKRATRSCLKSTRRIRKVVVSLSIAMSKTGEWERLT